MRSRGSKNRFKAITESRRHHADHRIDVQDRRPVLSLLSKRCVDRCIRFWMIAFFNDQKKGEKNVCLVTRISNGRIAQKTPFPKKLLCANVPPTCLCLHRLTNVCLYTLLSEQWHTPTPHRLHVTLSARKTGHFQQKNPPSFITTQRWNYLFCRLSLQHPCVSTNTTFFHSVKYY